MAELLRARGSALTSGGRDARVLAKRGRAFFSAQSRPVCVYRALGARVFSLLTRRPHGTGGIVWRLLPPLTGLASNEAGTNGFRTVWLAYVVLCSGWGRWVPQGRNPALLTGVRGRLALGRTIWTERTPRGNPPNGPCEFRSAHGGRWQKAEDRRHRTKLSAAGRRGVAFAGGGACFRRDHRADGVESIGAEGETVQAHRNFPFWGNSAEKVGGPDGASDGRFFFRAGGGGEAGCGAMGRGRGRWAIGGRGSRISPHKKVGAGVPTLVSVVD